MRYNVVSIEVTYQKGVFTMTFAEKMDQYMDAYCSAYKFSGMFRVTHKDQIIYQRNEGYADFEHKVPFSKDSVFTLYSMSKPFCVIGLMALADKGLVDIYAHPGVYVPEAAQIDERITVKHLMHHISGLRDYGQVPEISQEYQSQHRPDMREAVQRMASQPMNFEPGTGTRYSNINFTLLTQIIENVSGMQYADYMKQEVFLPLGMKNTQIDHLGLIVENRVRGYDINGSQIIATERVNPDFFVGAGDVISTVDDVYCLNHAIKHKKLLKPETWDLVLTPSDINVFGLGCQVWDWHGKKRIQHNGGSSGYRTLHVQLPEDDLDIILLSNFGFGDARWSLTNAVYAAFYGAAETQSESEAMDGGYIRENARILPAGFLPEKKPAITLTQEQESKLLGTYAFPGEKRPTCFVKEGDRYCIVENGWQKMYCYPVSETVLASWNLDEAYKISYDEEGKAVLNGRPKLG